ncbi:MAG TPA: PIN domain-containing protein [Terracidiphilus sp.]|jgi:predicted nucleic acid-binding protein|nr:PIN domain-containing protein [Terracidiphilus sp.]
MSRIFWDSMISIYLLEDHPVFAERALELLERSFRRNDQLFTSYFALGEIMAGAEKASDPSKTRAVQETLKEIGFRYLPFDESAVAPFSHLRAKEKLRSADCIHLACAASAGIDLFLTGDKQLVKLDVPGIQFIADFNAQIL